MLVRSWSVFLFSESSVGQHEHGTSVETGTVNSRPATRTATFSFSGMTFVTRRFFKSPLPPTSFLMWLNSTPRNAFLLRLT